MLGYSTSLKGLALQLIAQQRTRYTYLRNRARPKRQMLRAEVASEAEKTRLVLKSIHQHTALPLKDRLRAMLLLDNMHSYTRPGAIKERCVLTGRGNGMIRGWRINRITFREAAINGKICGLREAYNEK
ncbi:hypothetical protein MIR68_005030 [Amoeboaphelidium protococcarum]|nr:hypothetical protein MIR68_005030 [Amoeboaphelidium protococcarum]